ncbi:MAG: hypothetical protein WC627_00555 [Legionella sp.]|jgi:urea transporter
MSILKTVYGLPGDFAEAISHIFFGNEKAEFAEETPKIIKDLVKGGIVGSVLKFAYFISQSVSDAVAKHKSAISLAFWIGIGVAAAVAIAGAVIAGFYPALLATITGFSLYGISIAGLAGANVIAQIAVAAGLAAAAANVATWVGAAIVNAITWTISLVVPSKDAKVDQKDDADFVVTNQMSQLTAVNSKVNANTNNVAPLHTNMYAKKAEEQTQELEKSSANSFSA